MENIRKFKQWVFGISFVSLLGLGWACTDEDAPDNIAPGFSSFSYDKLMRTSVTLSAGLSGNVSLVKEYGFQYSTSNEFPSDRTTSVKVGEGAPTGNFTANVTGLERGETYYYRVYATTGGTTVYSKSEIFNTPSSSAPKMSDTNVIEIGENNAIVSFKIDDIGDEFLIECGVGYAKANATEKTYTPIIATPTSTDSVYVAEISDLEANTTYEFRPYAKNGPKADASEGLREAYGDIVTKKTEELMAPEVITEIETGSGINSITVSGLVESALGSNGVLFDCGFVWSSENQKPRLELNDESVSMKAPDELGVNFVHTITGLMANTTYYVCAYARNEVKGELKVGYGDVISVTTGSLMKPNINVDSYETTATSIILQATITNYDKGALKEKGFIYDRSSEISLEDAVKNGTIIKTLTGTNVYTDTIAGLPMNTSYMIRAYAVYVAEGADPVIGYSNSHNIQTNDYQAPNIGVEVDGTKITRNSAELVGKIYGAGNGDITERGFVLIESEVTSEPTLKHKGVKKIVSDESFVSVVKDLQKETSYSYRSYVISKLEAKVDTVYSNGYNHFQTLGIAAPAFNNVNLEEAKYNSFKVTCGISELGDGTLLEKGFWYKIGDYDFSEGKDSVIIETEANDEFSKVITGIFDYERDCYVCAYAKKEIDGVEVIFTSGWSSIWIPGPASTSFDEIKLDSVTYKSLKASATISSIGDGTLLEKGFFWKKGSTDFSYGVDSLVVESDNYEEFSATVTGFQTSSWYYGGAYTKMDINGKIVINRSGWREVWIPEPSSTYFKELNLEEATYKSFKVTCGINSLGDGTLLEKGFYYKKNNSDFSSDKDSVVITSDVLDTYSIVIDKNIESGTWYYVCAYVKMERDGNIITYQSSSNDIFVPEPSTTSFKDVTLEDATYKSFKATSGINSLGDGTLLEKGFYYRKNNSDFNGEKDSVVVKSDTLDTYSVVIDKNVDYDAWYYVWAYSKMNLDGNTVIHHSNRNSVYIPSPAGVAFNSVELDSATYHSFIAKSGITEVGDGDLLEKGFIWKANSTNFDSGADSLAVESDAHDSYSAEITGLSSGQTYYVRAYTKKDVNGRIVITRSGYNSVWTSNPVLPTFNDFKIDNSAYRKLDVAVKVTPGDGEILERGFFWGVFSEFSSVTIENNDGSFVFEEVGDSIYTTIEDLKAGSSYFIYAYAKVKLANEAERIVYSSQYVQVPDASLPSMDYWLSIPSDSITRTSFNVKATINSKGNGVITNRGFVLSEYDVNSEPSLKSCQQKFENLDESFTKTITGLKHNTTYAIRAFVIAKWEEDVDTVYNGGVSTVTTNSVVLPSLRQLSFTDNGLSTFKVTSEITNVGEGKLKEKGFCWSSSTSDIALERENISSKVIDADTLSMTLNGLDANTTYYVRAYAKVDIDSIEYVSYSNVGNTTTSSYSYPSLNTPKSDSEQLTRNSAYLTGVVNSVGNGVITEKGFVLSKTSVTYEPTIDFNDAMVVADEDFAATVTGLDWNTDYAARSYAISKWEESGKEEVVYSGYRTFRTSNVELPKFNQIGVDSLTYSSFKVSSGISKVGDGTIVEKGFVWKDNSANWEVPTLEASQGYQKVESDSIDSFELRVDSLLPGMPYYVRAYAKIKVDGKETVGYSDVQTIYTSSLGVNVNLTPQANSCDVVVEFSDEAANVKNVYFYLTTAEANEQDMSKRTKYTLTKDETTYVFSGALDKLAQSTKYYVAFYYEYAGNMVHHTNYEFTTKRLPQAGDNVSPGKTE